ncbi:MAG TPA: COX15/CtaA family protein [Mycobacteriales bacterium]|nr:COX15/CtaA family protein [Mycobacteriales bacterium]
MPTVPRPSPTTLRRLTLATLVANVGIVVTGGAVRLTGSGLGCPTWPRCTDDSYVPSRALAGHGLIEFGNRTLTSVLVAVTLATLAATLLAVPRRLPLVRLAVVAFLGIPAQIVLGGVTVLTDLNPWVVMLHFLLSAALIAVSLVLWQRAREPSDAPASSPVVRRELVLAGRLVVALAGATLVLGAVVTGSGPHAGDAAAPRTGLDPGLVSQVHADVVMLLIGLSIGVWVGLRASRAPAAAVRAAGLLVAVEAAQGLVGFTQYFTKLPALLVGLHMLGACLVWVGAIRMLLATRARAATAVLSPDDHRVSVAS